MIKATEKVYFKIGEIATELGVATSAIRHWGDQFEWTRPKYGRTGNRQYTRAERQEVHNVKHLVLDLGMTQKGVIKAKENGYIDELLAIQI
jgi:DNA-binding transcriptional MerR regulator